MHTEVALTALPIRVGFILLQNRAMLLITAIQRIHFLIRATTVTTVHFLSQPEHIHPQHLVAVVEEAAAVLAADLAKANYILLKEILLQMIHASMRVIR